MAVQNNLVLTGLQPLPFNDVPAQLYLEVKDPTSANYSTRPYKNFTIGTFWLNTVNQNLWYLADILNSPKKEGNWVLLSGGISNVETITTQDTNIVTPLLNTINVIGAGLISTTGTAGPNTVTINLASGGIAQSFPTDSLIATPALGVLNIKAQTATLGSGSSVSFSAPLSSNTVQLNVTDALANTIIGKLAGKAGITGTNNTALGYAAMSSLSTGVGNTGIGEDSLEFLTTGQYNTAVGISSLANVVTGSTNIGIGQGSGANYLTSESSNLIIGNSGGRVGESGVIRINTAAVGDNNVFIGQGSGSSAYTVGVGIGNIGVGAGQFTALTTGIANEAFGVNALVAVNTGSSNSALSNACLTALTTGSNNIAIGRFSAGSMTTGNNNISIGVSATTTLITGSNNTIIGAAAGAAYTGAESSNVLIMNAGVIGESNVIHIGSQGSGAGQQAKCFIAGVAGVTTAVADAVAVLVSASTGQFGTVSSSARFKENIQDMADQSSELMSLRPVVFNYKSDQSQSLQYGLIAEEVEEHMPRLVVYDDLGLPMTIKYHELPPILLNELQKLAKRVEELEKDAQHACNCLSPRSV